MPGLDRDRDCWQIDRRDLTLAGRLTSRSELSMAEARARAGVIARGLLVSRAGRAAIAGVETLKHGAYPSEACRA